MITLGEEVSMRLTARRRQGVSRVQESAGAHAKATLINRRQCVNQSCSCDRPWDRRPGLPARSSGPLLTSICLTQPLTTAKTASGQQLCCFDCTAAARQ